MKFEKWHLKTDSHMILNSVPNLALTIPAKLLDFFVYVSILKRLDLNGLNRLRLLGYKKSIILLSLKIFSKQLLTLTTDGCFVKCIKIQLF